jgi:hypothetical protein
MGWSKHWGKSDMKRFAIIAAYLALTVAGLFGTLSLCCGQEPTAAKPVKVFTYRFTSDFAMPGYPTVEAKARFKEAGILWSRAANVRFDELGPGKTPNVWVISRNRAGVWAVWSNPYMIYSTWSPNVQRYMAMTPALRDCHFRSLPWHEMFHVMGNYSNNYSTAQMKAWVVARYGPAVLPKGVAAPAWEIEPLEPAPQRVPRVGPVRRLWWRITGH